MTFLFSQIVLLFVLIIIRLDKSYRADKKERKYLELQNKINLQKNKQLDLKLKIYG